MRLENASFCITVPNTRAPRTATAVDCR